MSEQAEFDFQPGFIRQAGDESGLSYVEIELLVWLAEGTMIRQADGSELRTRRSTFAEVVDQSHLGSKGSVAKAKAGLTRLGVLTTKPIIRRRETVGTRWKLWVTLLRDHVAREAAKDALPRELVNGHERPTRSRAVTPVRADGREQRERLRIPARTAVNGGSVQVLAHDHEQDHDTRRHDRQDRQDARLDDRTAVLMSETPWHEVTEGLLRACDVEILLKLCRESASQGRIPSGADMELQFLAFVRRTALNPKANSVKAVLMSAVNRFNDTHGASLSVSHTASIKWAKRQMGDIHSRPMPDVSERAFESGIGV